METPVEVQKKKKCCGTTSQQVLSVKLPFVFYNLTPFENSKAKKENNLFALIIKMYNHVLHSLCSCHHNVNSLC